jgi:hypothetical protein
MEATHCIEILLDARLSDLGKAVHVNVSIVS